MRVHYLQHVEFEGPGHIKDWATENQINLSSTKVFLNQPLPSHTDYDWLIIMGGPMGVCDEDKYPWMSTEKRFIREAIANNKRVFGFCLGAQLIAEALGANVVKGPYREIGWHPIRKTDSCNSAGLFAESPDSLVAFHWHGDTFELPRGATHVYQSQAYSNQCFTFNMERVIAFQYHLETDLRLLHGLTSHCANEINSDSWVESIESMLNHSENIPNINKELDGILSRALVIDQTTTNSR